MRREKEEVERRLAAHLAEAAEKEAKEREAQEEEGRVEARARSDGERAEKQRRGLTEHLEKVVEQLGEVRAVPASKRSYWVDKVRPFLSCPLALFRLVGS